MVDAVTIFTGGSAGPGARQAEKLMEQVPVSTLGDVLPALIEKLARNGSIEMDSLAAPVMPGIDHEA